MCIPKKLDFINAQLHPHPVPPPEGNAVDLSFWLFVLMNIFYDTNNLRPLPLRGRDRVGGRAI